MGDRPLAQRGQEGLQADPGLGEAESLRASRVVDRAGDVAAQVRKSSPDGVDVCIDLAGPHAVGVQPDTEALAALARSCAGGELISRVAEVVPFDDAVEALRSLGHRSTSGKVVLDTTQRSHG